MANDKLTGASVSLLSVPSLTDVLMTVKSGDTTRYRVDNTRLLGVGGHVVEGRLTLETAVPVSTTDQTAKTNVFFTPYNGNRVRIYDGTRWRLYTFSELTLALGTLTSGANYDVFIYDNAGTLTLELSAAWTNDTTRADALTTQDGVYVKSGATTRMYLGTFRTISTTATTLLFSSDGVTASPKIFLWNLYNQVDCDLYVFDSTDSWTYSTATWRQKNAATHTNNKFEIINGLAGNNISLESIEASDTSIATPRLRRVGFGYDSTTAFLRLSVGTLSDNATVPQQMCHVTHRPGLGYHYYAELEQGGGADTQTFYGDGGAPTNLQTGMCGKWRY